MKFDYCPQCGEKLYLKNCGDEGEIPYCDTCKRPFFPFSYPCVICLCVCDNEIVLIKQGYVSENYINVAGYIKRGETPENTAVREVKEEIGLDVVSFDYIRSYYHEKGDNLMMGFICKVKKADLKVSCEVNSAKWFTLDEATSLLRNDSIGRNLLEDYLDLKDRKIKG